MRTMLTLSFLLAALVAINAADGAAVSGKVDGRTLELTPEIQTKLIDASAKLLATCSNIVVFPKNTLANAKRGSHLDFVFTPPRKFDLGSRATDVEVKEMVLK